MQYILTHENADFDALAAQLAAHKLYPDAIPILPRRVNRNVQAFLDEFGDALPFLTADDLKGTPRRTITRAIIVDTQGISTVRGMSQETPLLFIDHHPLKRDMEPHWTFTGDTIGATTTLLIERMQARTDPPALSTLEATLLLLGIYEDTGSLSYGTTTPRDIQAAAWALERGADLDLLRRLLARPISPDQEEVLTRLLESAETHEIGGYTVIIAAAEARDLRDGVSILAHRLRDMLNPDAILLLIQLSAHIQLVARSTGDGVNVGKVADSFGGGGHTRAAGAVIRDRSLAKAREELLALLTDLIRPQVTVRDLMSWGVRTVDAREQAAQAAEMMRRSGHEGYPVVENGRVIGLLTRHAVDRAMDHGMEHLPVEQLMNSGAITVTPDDSLETLQHIMSGMGWGQVPVTDEGGRILGVVTRTDLLNHLANHRTNGTSRREIVRLLQTALPAGTWSLVKEMAELAQEIGLGLYFVGGFVRDLLLEIPNNDLDLVVEGDAIKLAHALAERFGGEIHTHEQFGTAKWTPDDKTAARFPGLTDTIDFVTARSEFYERPTALPTVEQGSIKLDLHRRDFTINTLAVRLSPEPLGRLLDFWGGERDLQEGIIRVLHSLSFIDDPTRMLRAVRFEQRLDFTIEPRTLDLIKNALPLLNRVSGERIRREIALIFREENPLPALNRLDSLGILRQIHPALYVDGRLNAAVRALEDARRDPPWPAAPEDPALPYFILLTCRLDEATVELIMERLRFNRDAVEAAQVGSRLYPWITAWDPTRKPSEIAAKLDKLPDSVLLACWAMAVSDAAREAVTRYALEWRHVRPITGGHAIQKMGLKPGPAYGDLLGALRDAWLNGEITSEEEERALLEEMIAQLKSL